MATTKPLPLNLRRAFLYCPLTHPSPVLAGCCFLYAPRPSFAVIGRDVSYAHGAGAPAPDSARLAQAFCSGAHVGPVASFEAARKVLPESRSMELRITRCAIL